MHLPHTHISFKIKNKEMSPSRTALLVATQNVLTPPLNFLH
ncbi:hypothetical protein E2C01_077034 [Portunus trituberculatus]|uniref:Uncharacterized protein n=1 Tax=Portunus trituberculatus TaxID=210409 RepID=A0A5B7IAC2_PORTR|nr:hypothetical protein [Portunus trituberculatus]